MQFPSEAAVIQERVKVEIKLKLEKETT